MQSFDGRNNHNIRTAKMLCSRLSTGALFAALISTSSHLVGVVEATTPSEPFLYYVFYEDDAFGTQCRANPVAIKGYVSANEFPVTGGSGVTCAAEMACQIDANSNQCEDLDRTVSGSGVTVVTADGQIQECDSTNFVVGQTECFFFEGCTESSAYPRCNFDIVKTSDLQSDPMMLANDDPSDLEDYAYLVYYTDDFCTDIAGVKGAVSGTTFEIPRLGRDVACDDAMACVLQPDGSTCQTIRAVSSSGDLDEAKVRVQTRGDKVFECDSFNEAVGEDTCAVIEPRPCRPSSTIANCHFRWLSARDLATNPRRLVGDFGNNASPNSAGGALSVNTMVGVFVAVVTILSVWW